MGNSLEGKVAVITGAGRGIGRAIALEMAREKAKVVVNDIDSDPVQQVLAEIRQSGGEAVGNTDTVERMSSATRIIRAAVDTFGRIDILVNIAGTLRDRMFVNMTEDEWDSVIAVHLKGHFCCTKAAVDYMKEQRAGRIINVTSAAGLRGNQGQANYSSAKAAIIGFTKTLSMELAKYNITVNAIAPGAKTRMTMSIPEDIVRQKAASDPRYLALLKLPGPEYVAPLVAFLCTEQAKEVTGRIIGIKGNQLTLWSYPQPERIAFVEDMWTIEILGQRLQTILTAS